MKLNKGRDIRQYAAYMREQVTELLTQFGKIDIMWFDFSLSGLEAGGARTARATRIGRARSLYGSCAKLQPDIIINDRLDLARRPAGRHDA